MEKTIKVHCTQPLKATSYKELGSSMLSGKMPVIVDCATGKRPITKVASPNEVDETAPRLCTNAEHFDNHMDILCNSATLTYDLEESRAIECIYFASMSTVIHALADFTLYLSNDESALFNDESAIYHYCRGENEDESKAIDWLLEGDFGKNRYFGIKIHKASTADDIIRIGQIGLFNADYTAKNAYLKTNFPTNLIAGFEPKTLTNGVLHENPYTLSGEKTFGYTFDKDTFINKVVIIGKGDFTAKFDNLNVEVTEKTVENDLTEKIYYDADCRDSVKEINVTVNGNGEVHQIVMLADLKRAKVDFDKVINDDFYSIGADLMPMALMPESIESGYNEVYWQLEECRYRRAKPTVLRVWFQIDWVVTEYENYKNGIYDFENQKMQCIYRYFDLFKEIGTDIEFNFAWKTAEEAQEWFALKDVIKKNCSAPADLDLFAKCCAATLEELIVKRGYDNVKYLTFYNEPDHVDGLDKDGNDGYDFLCYGTGVPRKEYWRQMLLKCKEEIAKKNIDIKYWGCECSNSTERQVEWAEYFCKEHTGLLDMLTTHRYQLDTFGADQYISAMLNAANGLPAMLTECGQLYDEGLHSYNKNSVQLFCDMANGGYSGLLIWCISGIRFTVPSNFLMNNAIDFWHTPQIEGGIHRVLDNYYWWAMLSSYVPKHSKTVLSQFNKAELRVASFTHGDDYTMVVELPEEAQRRKLEIELAKPLNKKLYRYVLERPFKKDGNALLPRCCGEVYADDMLKDDLSGNYQEIVYTTIAPVVQVAAPEVEVFLHSGESYTLSGEVIDGNGGVSFELGATIGNFTLEGNKVTLTNGKEGDMCAVKVISEQHPEAYAIVIIKSAD